MAGSKQASHQYAARSDDRRATFTAEESTTQDELNARRGVVGRAVACGHLSCSSQLEGGVLLVLSGPARCSVVEPCALLNAECSAAGAFLTSPAFHLRLHLSVCWLTVRVQNASRGVESLYRGDYDVAWLRSRCLARPPPSLRLSQSSWCHGDTKHGGGSRGRSLVHGTGFSH